MRSKSIFVSKTFWVNAIAMLITLLTALTGQEFLGDYPLVGQGFVFLISLLNVVLRYLSNTPVHVGRTLRRRA